MHAQAGDRVTCRANRRVVLLGTPQAVLGCEEANEARAAQIVKQRDGVLQPPVDGRLVREDREPAPAQELPAAMDEHVEAGLHARHACDSIRSL